MADNSFKIKNSLVLTPVDLTTLLNPQAGDLACDINDSNKIKRYDANSSAWTEVGSGGVGSVDIMFVQDFESASLSTFTQTGLSLSTTDPLHGKVSALLTHQAAINQSFKQIIPVDRKFRGQAIVLDLNIKSAASAGNVTIKITDETGSVDLIASEQLQLSSDVSGRRSSVSFTIPSTCSSISYTITALPEAGSPVTRIDDIVAMLSDVSLLETSVEVPNLTAWQGYTPTFQGFGTPSNVEFEWRQVGENVEIRGKFTSASPTGVEARIGLPSGLTSAGTGLIPSIQTAGTFFRGITAYGSKGGSVLIEPSVSYITLSDSGVFNSSVVNPLSKAIATSIVLNGDTISFSASIPCAGLSATTTKTIPLTQSGLVQEGDSYLRIGGFTPAYASSNTRIHTLVSGSIQNSLGSDIIYADNATSGATFTAATAGIYNFSYSGELGSAVAGVGFSINSTQLSTDFSSINTASKLPAGFDVGSSGLNTVSTSVYLAVGDVIRLHGNSAFGAAAGPSFSSLVVTKQGSLKQVSVSSDQKITIPTSELRFEGASSRGSTATAIVKFDTLAKLRGDAFTVTNTAADGTFITMLKAGKLDVSATIYATAAGQQIAITKNSSTLVPATVFNVASELLSSEYTTGINDVLSASYSGFVSVGDIIRVAANIAVTSNSVNNFNLSFQEQDISVSVTNTLPQFSESDTSLRLDGANGYGSTATTTRRFASVVQNVGTDVEYTDSPTLGGQFVAKSAGVYNVSYTEISSANVIESSCRIIINGVDVAYNRDLYNTANANSKVPSCSWSGYLNAGDIVTAGVATAANNNGSGAFFTISKVGKPNVTGVDVTPFVNVPQPESQFLSATGGSGANAIVSNFSGLSSTNNGIISQTASRLTALKRCNFSLFVRATSGGAGNRIDIYKNGSLYVTGITIGSGSMLNQVSLLANIGDYFEVYSLGSGGNTGISYEANAEATSDQILTAPETFSTDTASLSYANASEYTLSTLQNAPVGTYITFTYAANTNTRTQTTLTNRPAQTDVDMNANGIQIFTRAYNAASTAASPAAVAIQIGKGLKGKSLDLYKSAGKVTAGSLDKYNNVNSFASSNMLSFGAITTYNELTGILLVDSGYQIANVVSALFDFSDLTTQTSGYLVINASKNPALTGISYPTTSPVAVRAYSTAGGAIGIVSTPQSFGQEKFDTNNAWNGTTFTAPQDGYYAVSAGIRTASVTLTTAQFLDMAFYTNGSLYSSTRTVGNGGAAQYAVQHSDVLFLYKGNTLQIYSSCSVATSQVSGILSDTVNFLSIIKQGS